MMLLTIEVIQIKFLGLKKYFTGWNVVDFISICLFLFYAIGTLSGAFNENLSVAEGFKHDGLGGLLPELKIMLFMISFCKIIFFCRAFDKYGILIQMAMCCIQDLIPFISFFFIVILLFSLCFHNLAEEISPNIDAPIVIPFMSMFLSFYNSSMQYIYVPHYNKMLEKDHYDISSKTNVFFIWVLYFVYSFFMDMMMINFIVAVVITTYDRVLLL